MESRRKDGWRTSRFNIGKLYFDLFNKKPGQFPSTDNKWLIFVDNKNEGRKLHKYLQSKNISTAYTDAELSKPSDIQKKLATTGSFDESVLIATSVIDCGINIKQEEKIYNIVISATDRTEFIQMLGRKRLAPGDRVNLWVRVPSKASFNFQEKQYQFDLDLAEELYKIRNCMVQGRFDHERYTTIARKIWNNRKKISTDSLIYIDSTGMLNCNMYVGSVIDRRLDFLQQFTRDENPLDFKDVVRAWLGKTEAYEEKRKRMYANLVECLEMGIVQPIGGEDIAKLRTMILDIAEDYGIEIEHKNRKENFSPRTLNSLLERLGIGYTIKTKSKIWSVEPKNN